MKSGGKGGKGGNPAHGVLLANYFEGLPGAFDKVQSNVK